MATTEPTRLMMIQGSRMAMYNGTQRAGLWETGDEAHPIDGAYYEELMPVVFDEAWFGQVSQQGRRFPVPMMQGQVIELQNKLTYALSKIVA